MKRGGDKFISRNIDSAQLIIYTCLFGLLVVYLILFLNDPNAPQNNLIDYYWNIVSDPLFKTAILITLFYLVVALIRLGFFIVSSFYNERDPLSFLSRAYLGKVVLNHAREIGKFIWAGIPIILTLLLLGLVLSYINSTNITRLIDERVVQWDKTLTSYYPFLDLGNLSYPDWFIDFTKFSFLYLPITLINFAFYVFHSYRYLFNEVVAVFSLNLVLMLFLWLIFPVISPQDRFIDNVYSLPISPTLAGAIKDYRPQPKIQEFLKEIRDQKNGDSDGVVPTSTLPSAHVAWATLLVYYIWRTKKELLVLLLPIAVLSTFGTVLFAQHYFVDVPAGILVLVLSLILVRWLKKFDLKIGY